MVVSWTLITCMVATYSWYVTYIDGNRIFIIILHILLSPWLEEGASWRWWHPPRGGPEPGDTHSRDIISESDLIILFIHHVCNTSCLVIFIAFLIY